MNLIIGRYLHVQATRLSRFFGSDFSPAALQPHLNLNLAIFFCSSLSDNHTLIVQYT
jgi:hypothetical protein